MLWHEYPGFAAPLCMPCCTMPALGCRSKEAGGALEECDPAEPGTATWQGVMSFTGFYYWEFNVTITLTPSGGDFGITNYVIGISVTQTAGPSITPTALGVVFDEGSSSHVRYAGEEIGKAWCTGAAGQPESVLIEHADEGEESYGPISLDTIESIIEDTAGPAGGWIEDDSSTLSESGFTEPFDDPGECETGYFIYAGEGNWSMRYFQNEFEFTGLTVDDWYCLTIIYEVRVFGAANWDDAWEVTVQAGFQATAPTDGPGWLGLPYADVAWNTEWRMKEYTLVNTGESEDCGGAPPPPSP